MEEKLNKLKTSLDKTLYKDINFEEQLQNNTITKLRNRKSEKRRYKPLFALITVVAVAFILFFSFDISTLHRNSANLGDEVKSNEMIGNESINYLIVMTREAEPSTLLININYKTNGVKYIPIYHKLYVENTFFENLMTAQDIEKALSIEVEKEFVLHDHEIGNYIENQQDIQVENEFDFTHGDSQFNEGVVTLNTAEKFVDFTSMRVQDPRGHNGRNMRVATVLEELFKQEDFYSIILKKEIDKFDEVLLSGSNLKLDEQITIEDQYINGNYSEKINKENLVMLQKSFK